MQHAANEFQKDYCSTTRCDMPFTLDRGCFCCDPAVPSRTQETPSDQLQKKPATCSFATTTGTNITPPAQNVGADAVELPQLQNVSLSNACFSNFANQIGWNYVSRYDTSDEVIKELEMCQIHDSCTSASNFNVTPDHRRPCSFSNLHMLQNRELGGKLPGICDVKPLVALSASSVTQGQSVRTCHRTSDNIVASTVSGNSVDTMDLDSALDELGMLSTVTNSRRQYLLETQGFTSCQKHKHRLHSKSESSPNLTTLLYPNGYHVQTSDFVYCPDNTFSAQNCISIGLSEGLNQYSINNLEDPVRHKKTAPRISYIRKDKLYRRSTFPYKVPHRIYSIVQDSASRSENLNVNTCPHAISNSLISETEVDILPRRLTDYNQISESKSNTASPVKPYADGSLVRSLSAEDLAPVSRHLEKELKKKEPCNAEQNMDLMTSQMTNLHMS